MQLFGKEAKSMKRLMIAVVALSCLTASAQIGVDAIAKQRARDVANKNNNRGTEPPNSAQPGQGQAAPAAPQMNAAQQAFANFQKQLFAITPNVTADQKSALAADMGNVAQGAKPTPATLTKLSDHLTTALGECTKLTTVQKTRIAREVGVLLNSANTQQSQKEAMVKDVQTVLEGCGAPSDHAAAVAADLTTVTEEIKPK